MPATLAAAGIHAGYPGVDVLSGVDLILREGDAPLGLIGPSGVGKTTLIDVLHGRIKPTQGRVLFDGRDVARKRGPGVKEFRAAVRFVSQYSLTVTDPRETVSSRLKAASKIARRAGRTHHVAPGELLASTGLTPEFLDRRAMTLSGGERQRLALATALATRPKILVLDEPLTAIDPGARVQVARKLKETIERLGMGVLVASHDLELIARLCPEVAFLAGGEIVERGPLPQVLKKSSHPDVRDLAEYAPVGRTVSGKQDSPFWP